MGVGAYSIGIFHLFTHAFFKALLFLGAGSVIHAVSDEQDMRKMGGLRKLIPQTYWMMIIGTIALTGLYGTAGHFSKDAVIEAAYVGHNAFAGYAFVLVTLAALLTSFYSWRLIFMTFHGKPRAPADVMSHVHESPPVMMIPLYVLAVGSLLAGWAFYSVFVGDGFEAFWKGSLFVADANHILEEMHHVPFWVVAAPTVMMLIGLALAWWFYIKSPEVPQGLAERNDWLYRFLLNKWYIDELYDILFVRSAQVGWPLPVAQG